MMQIVRHTAPMTQRMSQPIVRRPSLPLTSQDEADLTLLRESPAHLRALADLAPSTPVQEGDVRESVLLHAVFEAGLSVVRKAAEEEGYEQLAAEYRAIADERRSLSRRRQPAWSGES